MHRTFLLVFIPLLAPCQSPAAGSPNIILVMADDLGWSDIGCYGGEIQTPHIDALARDGLRFTQFYNNAVCGPTRASLLTGLYCQQTGHRGDHWNDPKDFKKCVSIGEVLQSAGYWTMLSGKWQGRDSALDRGFDRGFGPACQAKISYFHEVEHNPYFLNGKRWEVPDDFYLTESINHFAVEFLREALDADKPFFLYVSHIAPHWPLHAREADIAAYRDQYLQLGWDTCRSRRFEKQQKLGLVPAGWKLSPRAANTPEWKDAASHHWQAERMAVYAAQVASIDRGLGRLLKILDDAGKRDNTLVIFLSDNGAAPNGGVVPSDRGFGFGPDRNNDRWRLDGVPVRPGSGPDNMPGPHHTFAAYGRAWANISNTPLRGTKSTGFEGGIRTPLVARWPAVIQQQGGLTDQVGHVMDFMATFVEVAGARYPTELGERKPLPMEGKSLLPIFQGKQRDGHEEICWSAPGHIAIRVGKWKAVKATFERDWRLYDMESDGTETNDVAESNPDRVDSMKARFGAWRKRVAVE